MTECLWHSFSTVAESQKYMDIVLGNLTQFAYQIDYSQLHCITRSSTYIYYTLDADIITHYIYTVSQKVPTFKLSVTLSNLNRF